MSDGQIVVLVILGIALLFVLIAALVLAPDNRGQGPTLDPDLQADRDIQELEEEE